MTLKTRGIEYWTKKRKRCDDEDDDEDSQKLLQDVDILEEQMRDACASGSI